MSDARAVAAAITKEKKCTTSEDALPALCNSVRAKPSSRTVIQSQANVSPAALRKALKTLFSAQMRFFDAMFLDKRLRITIHAHGAGDGLIFDDIRYLVLYYHRVAPAGICYGLTAT